ncbi:transglutaminase family protein [Oxalobacteraceae bacterium R-40]|uniref:Transglutaminase family protein n=1 Tax=Keguizhuia sedimenti TaxID=3064264 RepID=A0ABU1BRA4_9BURK|nr:transglutaminase family protein [Oxalobacteraceae bacterium R-40]
MPCHAQREGLQSKMIREPLFEAPSTASIIEIGCTLGYVAPKPTPAFFMLQPHSQSGQTIVEEKLTSSVDMPVDRMTDLYGNRILKTVLVAGYNEFRYEALVNAAECSKQPLFSANADSLQALPLEIMRYALPSRYCDSDKLLQFAAQKFGDIPHPGEQAHAICNWVHRNLEYRYGSGDSTLSALEAIQRGYGVCRDFSHVVIALCRALDIPARYVAGYIPRTEDNAVEGENDIGVDFHAYAEIYFSGQWNIFDARYNRSFKGMVKIAHGLDAVDAAFASFYGNVEPVKFQVWARPVDAATLAIPSPADAAPVHIPHYGLPSCGSAETARLSE